MKQIPEEKALVPREAKTLNKTSKQLAIRQAEAGTADYVYHLNLEQVRALAEAAGDSRHGERNKLLVWLLFDGCLRCSEALNVKPSDLERGLNGWAVKISSGKGGKYGLVAISSSLAAELQAFAYRQRVAPDARFFPVSRPRAFQIVSGAFDKAGITRPSRVKDKVGTVHILRHSGALERLKRTGNPKSVQDQLRHKSALMTLRYMKTLSQDESLQIQQEVDLQW